MKKLISFVLVFVIILGSVGNVFAVEKRSGVADVEQMDLNYTAAAVVDRNVGKTSRSFHDTYQIIIVHGFDNLLSDISFILYHYKQSRLQNPILSLAHSFTSVDMYAASALLSSQIAILYVSLFILSPKNACIDIHVNHAEETHSGAAYRARVDCFFIVLRCNF